MPQSVAVCPLEVVVDVRQSKGIAGRQHGVPHFFVGQVHCLEGGVRRSLTVDLKTVKSYALCPLQPEVFVVHAASCEEGNHVLSVNGLESSRIMSKRSMAGWMGQKDASTGDAASSISPGQ